MYMGVSRFVGFFGERDKNGFFSAGRVSSRFSRRIGVVYVFGDRGVGGRRVSGRRDGSSRGFWSVVLFGF